MPARRLKEADRGLLGRQHVDRESSLSAQPIPQAGTTSRCSQRSAGILLEHTRGAPMHSILPTPSVM